MWPNVRNYLGITLGALLTAVALNMFLIPNKIAAGGVSGFATVLHYLLGLPVGMTMLALNIPLFFASVKVLGAKFGMNTLFGAAILSVATDLTAPFMPVLTQDILLSSVYGGVLSGVGMGLVFRFKGTTAGTDLLAAMLHKAFHIRVGQALLGVDFFVIASAGVAFASAELSLYALISLFVTTKIIDLIQEGPSTSKAFLIITDEPEAVAQAIFRELARGVTFFQAKGGYTGKTRDVLLCVVNTSEVTKLRDIVNEIDRMAFIIVADVHEVMGEGFTRTG